TELPQGQPEAVPDWLQSMVAGNESLAPAEIPDWLQQDIAAPQPEAAAPSAPDAIVDMPDWLKSVDVEAAEIPDWLVDTLGTATSEQTAVVATPPPPSTTTMQAVPVVSATTPTPGYSPAPVPVQVAQIDVQQTLENARSRANVNDIDGSLLQYEQLIR